MITLFDVMAIIIICTLFIVDSYRSYRRLRKNGSIIRLHHISDHILIAVSIMFSVMYGYVYKEYIPLVITIGLLLTHLRAENTTMCHKGTMWEV